jgi:CubicO group peptidase (beta-lactamase class C family)
VLLPSLRDLKPILVHTYPAHEVTTRSEREIDPRSVGLEQADVEAMWAAVVRYYRTGLHPSLAICLRRRGKIVLERAIGHARGNAPHDPIGAPKVLATPDTLYNFFSGSKAITAMLVHLCQERELLHVDEPVATFIPEFGRKRKHNITIRDVLCHRAGIPHVPPNALNLDVLSDPIAIAEAINDLEPVSRPGGSPAYSAITGGFVLAEVVRRVSGRDVQQFLTDEVRTPLEMTNFAYGVPHEKLLDVAEDAFTGPLPLGPPKLLIEKALGFPMPELVRLGNDARYRTGVIPAGNIIATPEEICRFFETLLCGGVYQEKQVFHGRTIKRATEKQVDFEFDRTLMLPIPYSMGFMLGSPIFGFYGHRTPRAFGHLGFTNVLGWADPDRDISCALMNNGKPLLSTSYVFWFDIMRTICARVPRDRSEG